MGIVVALNTRRPAPAMMQAAGSGQVLGHPLLASITAKLPVATARAIERAIATGMAEGATTAAIAREIAALGIDRRTAEGIARTAAAVVTDDARRRAGW